MGPYLPEEAGLPVSKLAGIFGSMSESYKIFWLQAIVRQVAAGRTKLSYEELIHDMVADAWYMVSEYKLNLGPKDSLEKLVFYVAEKSGLRPGEKRENILAYLQEQKDRELTGMIKTLTECVPYHLLAPFIPEIKAKRWDSKARVIEFVNNIYRERRILYYFENRKRSFNKFIIINEQWAAYIYRNHSILEGWIQFKLITYLQKRNPSVPGIPNKITPPAARNLDGVRKLWKGILEAEPVADIYTEKPLTKEYLNKYGKLAIDHFIPWSYVAHDELWNLTPTFWRINSSKGSNLPNMRNYLERFCRQQFKAFWLASVNEEIGSLFEKCTGQYVNSPEVLEKLYHPGISEKEFVKNLKNMLNPVYKSARSMGFEVWTGPEMIQ